MLATAGFEVEVTTLPQYTSLFPLRLAPFEEFMLQMECPGYPMVFYMELVLQGRMDRHALLEAVAEAAARHPLLLARVEADRLHGRWVLPVKATVPVDFQDANIPYHPPRGAVIDLKKESGLRVWVREETERTSVSLQIHHACCDGEGSRHFVSDLMRGYALRKGEMINREPTRVDYQRLLERAKFHNSAPNADRETPRTSLWQKIRNAYGFHVLGPAPLAAPAAPRDSKAAPTELPLMLTHVFSREETQRIEEQALESDTSVNDVAVALLLQTLSAWNRRHGRATWKQRLRILMPTDLRERADRWLTAANRVSFSFLGRTVGQCADWNQLVDGISQETKYIRTYRLGLDFIQIMAAVQRFAILVLLLRRWRPCMATAVLTNLGDTTRRFRSRFPVCDGYPVIGDVRLENVLGVPPIAPGTKSGFGICFCAGHMTISIRSDYARLSFDDSSNLLAAYVQAWKNWAAGRSCENKMPPDE